MYRFKLPDIGEGVSEGEIVKWHVKAGDQISRDQDMVEVMTDKVTVQIPSPVEGTVAGILFNEGQVVQVGSVLIEIQTEGGEPEEPEAAEVPPAEAVPPEEHEEEVQAPTMEVGMVLASPAVRRIAREKGIELSLVRGTGGNGRVTLEDLENYRPAEGAPEEVAQPAEAEAVPEPQPAPAAELRAGDEILEPRGLRRLIFEKMTKSKQIIPHFTVVEEVDLNRITQIIDSLMEMDTRLTYTSFFIKASAAALKEYPYLNALYNEESKNYTLKSTYNIGVAVDTPDGLTVPVIMDVDRKSLSAIGEDLSDLASRARKNQLKLHEVQNATFTVSNVGTIGGILSTPIINFPEVAILGVHRIRKEMVDGEEHPVTYLSLSCDHRLIDGAMATRFLVRLKEMLEKPEYFMAR